MAEIPIQRKEGRNIWPWVIGAIVLLALLWFLFGRQRGDTTAATTTDSTATMMAPAAPGSTAVAPGAPATSTPAPGAPAPGAPTTRRPNP